MAKYKVVPVEPTDEMIDVGDYARECGCSSSTIYTDMVIAAPDSQAEPVGWQYYHDGKWWYGDDRIKDHRKNTEEAGFRVRDVYAAPQPAPDMSALVEALEALMNIVAGYHLNGVLAEWDEFEEVYIAMQALTTHRKGGDQQ